MDDWFDQNMTPATPTVGPPAGSPNVLSPGAIGGARATQLRFLRAAPAIAGAVGSLAGVPGTVLGGVAGKAIQQAGEQALGARPQPRSLGDVLKAIEEQAGAGGTQGLETWAGGKLAQGAAGIGKGLLDAAVPKLGSKFVANYPNLFATLRGLKLPFNEEGAGAAQQATSAAAADLGKALDEAGNKGITLTANQFLGPIDRLIARVRPTASGDADAQMLLDMRHEFVNKFSTVAADGSRVWKRLHPSEANEIKRSLQDAGSQVFSRARADNAAPVVNHLEQEFNKAASQGVRSALEEIPQRMAARGHATVADIRALNARIHDLEGAGKVLQDVAINPQRDARLPLPIVNRWIKPNVAAATGRGVDRLLNNRGARTVVGNVPRGLAETVNQLMFRDSTSIHH